MTSISLQFAEDLLTSKQISQAEFEECVQMFENEIPSTRKLSSIRNMKDLLEVLNTLDICNENDISAYLDIANQLGDQALYNHLRNFKTIQHVHGENVYALERISQEQDEQVELMKKLSISKNKELDEERFQNGNISRTNSSSVSGSHHWTSENLGAKKMTIYKIIDDGVGRKWRSLGRELNVTEGFMDKYCDKEDTRVFKILEKFENDPRRQPTRFVFDLTTALINIRSRNLAKDIESFLANN